MEPYHYVFIHHQAFSLGDDFIGCFIPGLCIEWTQNYTSGGVIFQERIFMCLYTAFCKLGVQVVWHS